MIQERRKTRTICGTILLVLTKTVVLAEKPETAELVVAAHGWFSVEINGKRRIKEGLNVLAIEVAGYNCDSFYTVRQPSFLQAEIVAGDGRVLAATRRAGVFPSAASAARMRWRRRATAARSNASSMSDERIHAR